MRIGIDAHAIGAGKTGNETYTLELVQRLARLPANGHRFFVYLTDSHLAAHPPFQSAALDVRRIRPSFSALRLALGFPLEAWLRRLDLFHAQYFLPPNLHCRTVLTVHDVGFETYPELYDHKHRFLFRSFIPASCERADRIIAVSEFTRQDLVRHYGLPPDKIAVTYNAVGRQYRPLDSDEARSRIAAQYGITEPYVLYVGNLQPRKNLARLVQAFARLRTSVPPHKLVLVGQKAFQYGDIFRSVRDSALEEQVVFPGFVPADDLPWLYAGAAVFVYPSIFEGFGLPVIEAMACGAATVTSRGSALQEVAGDAAELADPLDVDQIRRALEKVLTDAQFRARLRQRALRRAAFFAGRDLGAETVRVYEQTAAG